MMKNLLLLLLACVTVQLGFSQITVTDGDINAGDNVTWTSDNEYLLDGYVFVESGATLTIEPGTVVKGIATPSTGDASSALIISRGAQIFAEGTAESPIIFTAELDDTSTPDDLTKAQKGLWGGLIVLGNATVGVNGDVQNIEGIPAEEGRAEYGGTDDEDNSGIIRYVSIRHAGSTLEANNEINGLTLGGVGSGTTIDYVEVFANSDDGIEWFGGTVNVTHAAVAFCGDDSYDYDQSYRGKGQYWFSIQDALSNRGGEWDGSERDDGMPATEVVVANATFIGGGSESVNEDGNDALRIRDRGAADVWNSVFLGFADRGIVLDNDLSGDSYDLFVNGDINFVKNAWFDFGAGSDLADIVSTDGGDDNLLITHLVDNGNSLSNPELGGVSRDPNGMLDPRLDANSPFLGEAELIDDSFFDPVTYLGAFGNSDNWCLGWTALDEYGYFGDLVDEADATVVNVVDSDINAGDDVTFLSENVYLLDGYVFVEEGACLTIEPGTVIKGKASPSTGDAASALIITRNAQIKAEGTADEPIIFTAEFDDTSTPDDLTKAQKGLWGGLIVLGNATVGVNGDVQNIEGIPAEEGRAEYGGTDDEDNSGIIRYVSIRHAGSTLEANNEINGLTLGGVGSGTTIDYVEVFANSDDGIEWFGGTVNVTHAAVAFCGDDSYDYDQSYRGKGQYWFSIQDALSNRGGEWDGSERDDGMPATEVVVANATFIGGGSESVNEDGNDALRIRDRGAADVWNSVFLGFADRGIVLDNDLSGDSYDLFVNGDINFVKNAWFDFGAGSELADIVSTDGGDDNLLITHLVDNGNSLSNPELGGVSRDPNGMLDPRLDANSPFLGEAELIDDSFFDPVTYLGAFGNSDNWCLGWTALDEYGYFGDLVDEADATVVNVVDSDINAGDDVTFLSENVYLLDGYVFVEEGACLTIEPGTVIKGKASPSTGDAASALIITRNAQIKAEGTADEPIIFTAEFDDTSTPDDLTKAQKGLWGGLIVLGNATVGVNGDVQNIEGIPAEEGRAEYGGTNDEDNSGIIRYVSIRHAGSTLEANNEINGLTLGGVGSGTVIDHVEVFANSDDGIEWFGGTVNVTHAAVAFCGDDSYDYDQSYRGKGQYWFSIQDALSNRGGEWDGSERDDGMPATEVVISNATFIGGGSESVNEDGNDALRIRDRGAADVWNSIFVGFADRGIVLDNDFSGDSYDLFVQGDINFVGNVWFDFGAGSDLADIVSTDGGDDNILINHLTVNGNQLVDPVICVSREADGGLDPRLDGSSPVLTAAATIPNDPFFDPVEYVGAFASTDDGNWCEGWTALDEYGYFSDCITVSAEDIQDNETVNNWTVAPNPFDQFIQIEYTLNQASRISLALYDMNGRMVEQPIQGDFRAAGNHVESYSMFNVNSGSYLLVLSNENGILATSKVMK